MSRLTEPSAAREMTVAAVAGLMLLGAPATAAQVTWVNPDNTLQPDGWPDASQEWAYCDGENWNGRIVPQDNDDTHFWRGTFEAVGRLDTTTNAILRFVSGNGSQFFISPTGNLVLSNADGRMQLGNTTGGSYVNVAEGGQITWSGAGTGNRTVTLDNGAILDMAGTAQVPTSISVNSGTTMNILPGASIGAGRERGSIEVRGTINQSGGAVVLPSVGMLGGTYTISGGSIAATFGTGALEFYGGDASSTFKVVGSEATSIQFETVRYNTTGTKTWAFVLDNGANHITPVQLVTDGFSGGTLRDGATLEVGLRGGVLLSGTDVFTLIERSGISKSNYLDYWAADPGPLWMDATEGNLLQVALNSDAAKGSLNASAAGATVRFDACPVGYITLTGLSGTETSLKLKLHWSAGSGASVSDFITLLESAGITCGQISTSEIGVGLNPSVSGSNFFAWDLEDIGAGGRLEGITVISRR